MIPNQIQINFCLDGKNLPPENCPVLCIFPDNGVSTSYEYCTVLQNLEKPDDKFWVKHNSLEKSRVYPYAWIGFPNGMPDSEFMAALAKQKVITFQLPTLTLLSPLILVEAMG